MLNKNAVDKRVARGDFSYLFLNFIPRRVSESKVGKYKMRYLMPSGNLKVGKILSRVKGVFF